MNDVRENAMQETPSDAKLIWNCRRGMLELDLILSRFVERHLPRLNVEERLLFERLLNYPDPVLYGVLMDQVDLDDEELMHFVYHIRTQYSV